MANCLQYRKRKITDKNLPNSILHNPEFAVDSQMYQDLLEMERKLDWTVTRKRVEVTDAVARVPTVRKLRVSVYPKLTCIYSQMTRTLRIFLSHTVSGQTWQTTDDQSTVNVETGEGVPAWQLRIDGRLLDVSP